MTVAGTEAIDYQVKDRAAWIRLNRPDSLNAFNAALRSGLLEVLERAAEDREVRTVVLTSAGRAFCAGADLLESKPADSDVISELMGEYYPILRRVRSLEKPVIGVAPGVAAGVGASLLMACDQVLMSEEARIYLAFCHIGLVPDGGATWLLCRSLGYHRAFALITEGGSLDARECLRLGIAREVVPGEALDARAAALAATLAERSALATAKAKALLHQAETASFDEVFRAEAEAQKLCMASEESKQAIARFRQGKGA
ncbi:MAG: enoyl-CoA hydratase/isomerase family protein [Ectothiorhodospiraceae bacterium]|nr:enoyl-CoA hydratase/isomerase family protein [Ectothiorhodospiraceae bacterium]